MRDQRSRLYHRQHPPRTERGTFAPGVTLYTRHDGASRWLRTMTPAAEHAHAEWLSEQGYRVLRDLVVIAVAALLVILFG